MVISICCLFACSVSAGDIISGDISDNAHWEYDGEETLTFTGTGSLGFYNKYRTPWAPYSESVKRVVVEEGITNLGNFFLLGFSVLEEVQLPSTLEIIGTSAFEECISLESINIPLKVTKLEKNTFKKCSKLSNIDLHEDLQIIGIGAFEGCSSLEDINLPSNLTVIGTKAFRGCVLFEKITIPESVIAIDEQAFSGCVLLSEVNLNDKIETIGRFTFENCVNLKSISIPNNVTWINSYAFANCVSIEYLSLPPTLDKIYDHSFFGCTSLKEVNISEGVVSIQNAAFGGCTSLKTVKLPTTLEIIHTAAFEGCKSLETVYYRGSIENFQLIRISDNNEPLTTANIVYGHTHEFTKTYVEQCGFTSHMEYRCECGYFYTADHGSYVYHEWEMKGVCEATCTEGGYTIMECKKCSMINHTDETQKTDHLKGEVLLVKDSVCDAFGYTLYACSYCGAEFRADLADPLGHDFSDEWTVDIEPTATKRGQKSRHCSRCDQATDFITCVKEAVMIDTSKKFSDVSYTSWAKSGIDYIVSYGYMNGTGDGTTFDPGDTMSRAMIVTVLYRIADEPSHSGNNPFTDIETGWYYDAVLWAYENGIVTGTSSTTFSPNGEVTREQIATFIYRFAKYADYYSWDLADISKFPDIYKVNSWSKEALAWANAEDFINGVKTTDGVTMLDPQGMATREQVATILMRLCKAF